MPNSSSAFVCQKKSEVHGYFTVFTQIAFLVMFSLSPLALSQSLCLRTVITPFIWMSHFHYDTQQCKNKMGFFLEGKSHPSDTVTLLRKIMRVRSIHNQQIKRLLFALVFVPIFLFSVSLLHFLRLKGIKPSKYKMSPYFLQYFSKKTSD